jgi:hypothetical protein
MHVKVRLTASEHATLISRAKHFGTHPTAIVKSALLDVMAQPLPPGPAEIIPERALI